MNLFCYCCLNMAPHQGVTKKWEVFAGRNKFFCDGYLMTAPNSSVFYFTVILITGTSGLFFAFDCPFLSERISPAIPIVGALLFLFTMSSLLRTSFSDPGVIPRASHDEAAYIEKQIEVPNSLNSPTYRPPPRTKEVLVKGQTVKLKYCVTCKIFRPPRASHCSICDNCVDRFDHHCPWVGNCVGKRNYRFFYMFIVSLAFLAVFIYACAMTHMVLLSKDNEKLIDIIKTTPASVIVAIICFFSVWSIIGLAGFHTYLTTSDQTTNEDIKGSFSSKGAQQSVNPYSQGNICLNCFHILCGPISPSLLDRRGIVTDEYRIQMQDPTRYNCTVPQPLVTQPIGSSDHTTIHIHDMEITPTLPNTGMYRQRSYDNLENGNSTSVTHLVDNELPLSILNSPNDININDDDNIGNLSNLNNMSGSYNNLYRDDKLENDNDDNNEENNIKILNENNNIDENIIIDINNSIDDNEKSKIILKQQQQQQQLQQQLSENVYSNIPTTPPARITSTVTTTPIIDNKINSNLHVYSNVTTSTPKTTNLIKSTPIKTKLNNSISNNNISNNVSLISNNNDEQQLLQIKTKPIKIAQHQQQQQQQNQQSQLNINNKLHNNTINNSTSFINDLDLDDPVIETSAFGNLNNNLNNNNNNINNNTNSNKNDEDLKNNSLIKLNDVMNIKNVPQVVIIDNNKGNVNVTTQSILSSNNMITTTAVSTVTSTASLSSLNNVNNLNNNNSNNTNNSNNNNNTNSNVFISPSRLRLLQDTTMIDTALDLDSLDGSSIGNTSQACLIKTAMV